MTIVSQRITFVDKFLNHFNSIFTKKQMSMFRGFMYGMCLEYKRLSLAAITNRVSMSYQQAQYFFSEADWDINALNDIRLKVIQRQRTTRAGKNGVLAIDDTACPKPHAEKTEGAKFQYCGVLGREENCNVAVASCFVSETKRFPVDFKSYIPMEAAEPRRFKSKLDLAKELIDEAARNRIPFSTVVVDSWYASSDLIEFVASKNILLVSEVKINRSVLFTHPETRQWRYLRCDDIIPLVKKHYANKLKPVSLPQKDGTQKSVFTYTFNSKLKDCKENVKIIFVFAKWSAQDEHDVHVIITTNRTMSVKAAITTYLLRWGIEESFRELKDTFCFDQYQVRHQEQIQRHWIMSFLAWTLTYWIKQNGCLSKILEDPPQTIGECKRAVASLIIIDSAFLLSKNGKIAASLYKIKSERFRKRLQD